MCVLFISLFPLSLTHTRTHTHTHTHTHTVEVHGDNWNAADALARKLVEEDPSAAYIPPYDHPLLWNGHSTLIDELVEACPVRPAAIVASVGGGGLLCGIYEGLLR